MPSPWHPSSLAARSVSPICALFLAVTLGACGSASATRSPTPAPAARTPQPAPTSEVFKSSRFGYSIRMTSDWRLNEIPGHWTGYVIPNFMGDTGTDAYTDIVTKALMEIGYLQLADGTSLDDWTATEAPKATFSDCHVTTGPDSLTVAGQDARYMLEVCPAHMVLNVFLVRGSTGIFSHFVGEHGGNVTADAKAARTVYLTLLDTLQFG